MSFGSFNTASVLIQPDKVAIERKMNLFQYSFCSYSTSLCQGINCINHRFNTASVLIQPVHPSTSGNCYRVSIQLLFLFNVSSALIIDVQLEFQYSFCSYSTNSFFNFQCVWLRFNTASVLIQHVLKCLP